MTYLIILVLVLIFLAFVIRAGQRLSKGPARTMEQLSRPIEDLLKRGFDGGTLLIEHSKSKKFIQFRKYISGKGHYGIELFYPEVEWSRSHVDDLKRWSEFNKYDLLEILPGVDSPTTFYKINFKKNSNAAFECVKALSEMYGIPESAYFYVLLENAEARDILVDE